MKSWYQQPKFYVWLVSMLLQVQAVLFMYCLSLERDAWVAFAEAQPEHFVHLDLFVSKLHAAKTMMWVSLGLFVCDIVLLQIALRGLDKKQPVDGANHKADAKLS